MTTKHEIDREDAIHHADVAMDAILTIRLALGGVPDSLPHHGFDRALLADESYQAARSAAH